MESLLKLSGILNQEGEDEHDLEKLRERVLADKTMNDGPDPSTLEKRLTSKTFSQSSGDTPTRSSEQSSKAGSQPRTFDSPRHTPQMDRLPGSRDPVASPAETSKDKGEPVEELSDMMCSLVTNNCGDTRFIGRNQFRKPKISANTSQDLPLASLFSLLKVYNGSTKRLEIAPFKT